MSLPNEKLYQDQIYGAKVLSPLAVAIIDSPEFQRLDHLRQLGFANLGYRGAHHTRFAHSVGTYFISRTILRRIVQNHDRLRFPHPGKDLSDRFRLVPHNSDMKPSTTTAQARWRGLMEIVSAAALLHDIPHVPFGHTLEDEFAGIFKRHDRIAGPRLYEMMFNEASGLRRDVFSDSAPRWLDQIPNEEVGKLIYLILNWKEVVHPPVQFATLLEQTLADATKGSRRHKRLSDLKKWYVQFKDQHMFEPFMSDIVGNTICADLLDYIPRDRTNLGLEPRFHTRLQRYLTIRPDALHRDHSLRLSILVTRKGRGGQRRDVATAVLDIMRERYEMAERVFYHHKKAAASTMLAKLLEIAPKKLRPRDDDAIYPAPWDESSQLSSDRPHMTHLTDSGLIDYLGCIQDGPNDVLRAEIYRALRFDRRQLYRTLLVIDLDLVQSSKHPVEYYCEQLRGPRDKPSTSTRQSLESTLADAASSEDGTVLLYCPSADMQSKEVDARLEILEGRVLPLRLQTESFAYKQDLAALEHYYRELWRAYIFVSADLYRDPTKCLSIVDRFCEHFGIPPGSAYTKVRGHEFDLKSGVRTSRAFKSVRDFLSNIPFDLPKSITTLLLGNAADDEELLSLLSTDSDARARLTVLLDVSALEGALSSPPHSTDKLDRGQVRRIKSYREQLMKGSLKSRIAARTPDGQDRWPDFDAYLKELLENALRSDELFPK